MPTPNGCGPVWLPGWIKALLFNWFFEASCDKHDIGYAQGGDEVRRFECDWKFLHAMLRDTRRQKGYLKPLCYLLAWVFFALVRLFGWLQFNYLPQSSSDKKES